MLTIYNEIFLKSYKANLAMTQKEFAMVINSLSIAKKKAAELKALRDEIVSFYGEMIRTHAMKNVAFAQNNICKVIDFAIEKGGLNW